MALVSVVAASRLNAIAEAKRALGLSPKTRLIRMDEADMGARSRFARAELASGDIVEIETRLHAKSSAVVVG